MLNVIIIIIIISLTHCVSFFDISSSLDRIWLDSSVTLPIAYTQYNTSDIMYMYMYIHITILIKLALYIRMPHIHVHVHIL